MIAKLCQMLFNCFDIFLVGDDVFEVDVDEGGVLEEDVEIDVGHIFVVRILQQKDSLVFYLCFQLGLQFLSGLTIVDVFSVDFQVWKSG